MGAGQVVIRIVPKFMSKNATPNAIPKPLQFPGGAHFFPWEPKRALCPVHALAIFINRTKQLVPQDSSQSS